MKRNRCISSLTPGGGKQKLRHSSWQFRSKEEKLLLDDLWVTFGGKGCWLEPKEESTGIHCHRNPNQPGTQN